MGKILNIAGFVGVFGLAASLASGTADNTPATGVFSKPDPVSVTPLNIPIPDPEFGCDDPDIITRDANGTPWVKVNTMTADAVPLSFEITFNAKAGGDEIDRSQSVCHILDRHVYSMAESIFAGHIIKTPYKDFPENGPNIVFGAARNVETMVNTMLSAAGWYEISGLGLRNVDMPGLSDTEALQMMTRGKEYDDSAVEERFTRDTIRAETYEGYHLNLRVGIEYDIGEKAYYTLGPYDQAVHYSVMTAFETAAQDVIALRPAYCVENDLDYIKDEIYLALTPKMRDTGLAYVFEINIHEPVMIESQTENPAARDYEPICISSALTNVPPAP